MQQATGLGYHGQASLRRLCFLFIRRIPILKACEGLSPGCSAESVSRRTVTHGLQPLMKESDLPWQIGKQRLGTHGCWGLDLGHQVPAGCAGRHSGNTGDLSQCAGREGFLEVEELVLGGWEEVGY